MTVPGNASTPVAATPNGATETPDFKDVLREDYWRTYKDCAQPVTWSPEALRELATDARVAAEYIEALEVALDALVTRTLSYVRVKRGHIWLPFDPLMECDAEMYGLASAGLDVLAAAPPAVLARAEG